MIKQPSRRRDDNRAGQISVRESSNNELRPIPRFGLNSHQFPRRLHFARQPGQLWPPAFAPVLRHTTVTLLDGCYATNVIDLPRNLRIGNSMGTTHQNIKSAQAMTRDFTGNLSGLEQLGDGARQGPFAEGFRLHLSWEKPNRFRMPVLVPNTVGRQHRVESDMHFDEGVFAAGLFAAAHAQRTTIAGQPAWFIWFCIHPQRQRFLGAQAGRGFKDSLPGERFRSRVRKPGLNKFMQFIGRNWRQFLAVARIGRTMIPDSCRDGVDLDQPFAFCPAQGVRQGVQFQVRCPVPAPPRGVVAPPLVVCVIRPAKLPFRR